MKNAFIAFCALILLSLNITSCKKDHVSKTKTQLLTGNTWIYDEYFTNYNSSNTILAYKIGKANNSMNLSLNKVKFNTDGTYQETTETGQQLTGTWKFLNNESQTQVVNTQGTFTSNVIILDETHYEWYDATSGRYGKMIPAN